MLQIQFKFGRCDVAARDDRDDHDDDDDLLDPATFGDSITRYHTFSDEILDNRMNRDKIPRAYDLTARRER